MNLLRGKIKLIAISGGAGSGKTRLSQALAGQFGYTHFRFAQHLYDLITTLPFLEEHRWKDRAWKEAIHPFYGRSPRYLLQTLGTEWGRDLVGEDIWIRLADHRVNEHQELGKVSCIVFDDLRFENEAKWVESVGGICIRLSRQSGLVVDNPTHASEVGIPAIYINHIMHNDSTVEYLMQQAPQLNELAEAARVAAST